MPYLDDVLNPYQSLTGDLTPEDTLTGLLSEDGLLQGAIAISDVVGVTQLTELTDVSITNPLNNDVLTYNDVTEKWENMPAQGGGGGGTSDYNDLDNKPSINSVTLTGNKTTAELNISYDDLDDKPTIPTELDDLSDVNINNPYQTDVLSYDESSSKWINHPVSLTVEGLSNVALSTPFAGEVLKISSVSGGVTTWRSSNVKYSEIDNTPTLATVATSGDYNDLTNKPTIPAAQVNSDWNASSGVAEILNKPTLATVATSGDYDDLINTPVPAYENKGTISDLNNVDLDDGGAYKYIYNAGASNKPGTGGGTLLHMWNSGNHAWGCQVAFSDKGMYFRGITNSTFGAWNTIVSV